MAVRTGVDLHAALAAADEGTGTVLLQQGVRGTRALAVRKADFWDQGS